MTSSALGLTSAEVDERRRRDGPNRLPHPRPAPRWWGLVRQMTHFFAVLLWVAAVLAVVAGMPALAVAIVLVVVINGVFAFWQEDRADRAAERLRDLLPVRASVIRDGVRLDVDAADLVVDDVVLLSGGDRVCADLQVVDGSRLAVDESLLTGESSLVHPSPSDPLWAGSYVVEGEATSIVVAIGGHTALAGVAALTAGVTPPVGPLTQQLSRVVRVIAAVAVSVGAVFFGIAVLLGTPPGQGFLFAIGVTVALVPEGLLPTVTLSLARGAQSMAREHALVRRLDAVETLGSTTYICSDKTGTLTRNQMSVVEVWTPVGVATTEGEGYDPRGRVVAEGEVAQAVRSLALTAMECSGGRVRETPKGWVPTADPMEAALHVLALRAGVDVPPEPSRRPSAVRFPFDPRRRRESTVVDGVVHVKGAPDAVLPRCAAGPGGAAAGAADAAVHAMAGRGLRVLAVARRSGAGSVDPAADPDDVERDLELLGLVGIEDPPRAGAAEAVESCRQAGIRMAMVTGDHPGTARAIAEQVGLWRDGGVVVNGSDLPTDEVELGELLDREGVVIARVTPADKLRIA
ncbi:MAG: HAD-IC family P-type ATPase, partial [Actinomycetes bacterium]